jgi:predicted RNA-binding protein with PIN domain
MFYYIDGYNLIFTLVDSKHPLSHQRKKIIQILQTQFASLQLKGMIVFDGSHKRDEESGLSYANPLDIAYTPKGQTADEYIVEKLQWESKRHLITVVSNDRGLLRHAQELGGKTQSNESFINYLKKRKSKNKKQKFELKETQKNIDRLLKIFEERLNNEYPE